MWDKDWTDVFVLSGWLIAWSTLVYFIPVTV